MKYKPDDVWCEKCNNGVVRAVSWVGGHCETIDKDFYFVTDGYWVCVCDNCKREIFVMVYWE